jgi:hypothetical protein
MPILKHLSSGGGAMSYIKSCAFIIFLAASIFVLNKTAAYGYEAEKIYVSVEELNQTLDGNWENAFTYVRDRIHFEPSAHFIKSPQGVLWGRSGNALEQAVLLAEVLRGMGKEVRLASGTLSNADCASLIQSIFPREKDFSYGKDILLSRPSAAEELIANVKQHSWVQIKENDDWLDLDPTFPEAAPGKAYAEMEKSYPSLSDDVIPKFMISLSVEKGGNREDVLMMEKNLQEMTNKAVTLSIFTSFQESKAEGKSGGSSPGGAFRVLRGSTSSKKKAKGLEAVYKVQLNIGREMETSGQFKENIADSSKKASAKDAIDRAWLNFRLTHKEQVLFETERVLFEKFHPEDELPLFQRHSILITGNTIPLESWESKLRQVSDDRMLEKIKASVVQIKKSLKSKKDKNILLKDSLSLEEKLGRDLGHLVNMIFAYTSDSITSDAGESFNVFSYYALPRIIITSIEGDGKDVSAVMDLRQDRIEAIPHPGQALAMAETFHYGRGVFESVLEGAALELFLGKKALTTAYIMQEASKNNISIQLFSGLEKDELGRLGMPHHVWKQASKSLASGFILIVPERSIRFNGEDRWGWWQVNPETREVVGVLDTGLHQATLQRTVLETEGPLDSKMGFAVGAIVGAVDTQWMLASMVLKYGELNKKALQEIKAYMQQIKAYMCPEFEKEASVTIASVTIVDIEDCYKKEYSWSYGGDAKVEMGWCQAFAKGFGCASTSILNDYLSKYE